jgi:hypothetical protein
VGNGVFALETSLGVLRTAIKRVADQQAETLIMGHVPEPVSWEPILKDLQHAEDACESVKERVCEIKEALEQRCTPVTDRFKMAAELAMMKDPEDSGGLLMSSGYRMQQP